VRTFEKPISLTQFGTLVQDVLRSSDTRDPGRDPGAVAPPDFSRRREQSGASRRAVEHLSATWRQDGVTLTHWESPEEIVGPRSRHGCRSVSGRLKLRGVGE